MIAVRLEGRLGNQLFQYAFIYSAAKKLGVPFYLDQSIEPYLLDKYFDVERDRFYFLQRVFSIRGYKNLFSFYLRRSFYAVVKFVSGLGTIKFDSAAQPTSELTKLVNGGWYLGFFQSEQYFADNKPIIAKLFNIKQYYRDLYLNVAAKLPASKKLVVVHIRRTDFLDFNGGLPDDYYRKAIDHIKASDPYFIFISDDPDYVERQFDYVADKYVSRNSEIIDFQLLMHADICILSSSSFSWWGAWLNKRENKKVYAPKYWLGNAERREYPIGVFADLGYQLIDPN